MFDLHLEIQKRHTLNWLIQGAAQHAGMTFHHLVKDELNALDERLLRLYDWYALINLLQYWQVEGALVFGWPPTFWSKVVSDTTHPFFGHPLLSNYGGMLAEEGRQRGLERCKEKGLTQLALKFGLETRKIAMHIRKFEAPYRHQLTHLAKETASMVWGIPQNRLDAELCSTIVLDKGLMPARNLKGKLFRSCIVGYGGTVHNGDGLSVVSRATNWQLLCKELVKGTAELICLHGLNQLDDETYHQVLNVTDHLDLEPWMLQSGGEFWRRILPAFPDGQPIAKTVMHLARLPAGTLESVIAKMINQPEKAKTQLTNLQ